LIFPGRGRDHYDGHSIDPLAPYKVSDDLLLELASVTAIIKLDPEGAAAAACWVEINRTISPFTNPPAAIRSTIGRFTDLRQERRHLSGRRDKGQGGSVADVPM
jgi:hypothetical protein